MTADRRPFQFADFLDMQRASQPRVSPDGRWLVFAAARPDLEQNRNIRHLHRLELANGESGVLTTAGTNNMDPAFSPDGRFLAFTSNRGGSSQIWILPMGGGEARQLTKFRTGARDPVWLPDGRGLLCASPVFRDTHDPVEIGRRLDEREKPRSSGRVLDRLMFRHWDSWTDDMVEHLFSVDVATGAVTDLTPGPWPVPPTALSGSPDYAVSPDGSEICFVSLRDDAQAISTNLNLWIIPVAGGEPKRISPWAGANSNPVYSPCGRYIAYLGQRRAGYESDLSELLVYDRQTGQVHDVAYGFDHAIRGPTWSPDGRQIAFYAEDRGASRLWVMDALGGVPKPVTGGPVTDRGPRWTADGRSLVFVRESFTSTPDIWQICLEDRVERPLTRLNAAVLSKLDLPEAEEFCFAGAGGLPIQGWLLRPPGFEPGKKYPVVYLIHGGPQGSFGADFHERWNSQLFAAPGYVVFMVNFRGSTGFGQAFTDAIHGEWGGTCYEDVMLGLDHVLAAYDFCDPQRVGAAGASFGGFMVNWIAGHTDRFQALVCHDGIFNTEMMDWATDELWFSEWEFGGLPWANPEGYRKWSPHLFVEQMKTPMLVVQGEQDFRCPASEGLNLFTALQRRGVPSRLLYFPDEGHWVVKPRNRQLWWETVHGWLGQWLKG